MVKQAPAQGRPMIVTAQTSPAMAHRIAISRPPKIIQITLSSSVMARSSVTRGTQTRILALCGGMRNEVETW